MSYFGQEEWAEKCQEKLDHNTLEYVTKEAALDLVFHIKSLLHPTQFEEIMFSWLETPAGKKWYEKALDSLIDNAPEPEWEPE